MIISAHQPAYLPWAGYLHRIAISDVFVILDNVQFEKNSFTNRNRIKSPSGSVWLTVPVSQKGHMSGTISDIKIAKHSNWLKKQWKTIQQSYAKALYFKDHKVFFESIFTQDWDNLTLLNETILNYLLAQFQIDTPLLMMSELDLEGKKQDLIIDICKTLNADQFIFGGLGAEYVDTEYFKAAGIVPHYHEYTTLPYNQLWGAFEENLSIIDMLFNVPPVELRHHLFASGEVKLVGQS